MSAPYYRKEINTIWLFPASSPRFGLRAFRRTSTRRWCSARSAPAITRAKISQWGDTVHISNLSDITVRPYDPTTDLAEPEALSGTDIVLTIDHGAYYNFLIGDVTRHRRALT